MIARSSSRNCGKRTRSRIVLPTEAEWEYACRAGTTTPFHFGETISTDQANYDGNFTYGNGKKGVYREKTTPVGSFPANAWGLYDMHGNVWQWCQDWYGDYPQKDVVDPQGPEKGEVRVLRGGSWISDPQYCRSAFRYWFDPWPPSQLRVPCLLLPGLIYTIPALREGCETLGPRLRLGPHCLAGSACRTVPGVVPIPHPE